MGKGRCAALVLGVLLFAGCGQVPSTSQPGGNVSTPSPSGTQPASPTPRPSRPPTIPPTKGPQPGEETIRGEVAKGVEAGCMMLKTDNGRAYLLIFDGSTLITEGARLEAVGRPNPDLMTTCQQGIPFQVSRLRRI
jgi:hypothetical protein